MDEKTIKRKLVYAGKIINLRIDSVLMSNGREALREIVEHPGAVAIVPVMPDGKIIFVKQYRKPVEEVLLEIPAGKLEKGESAKDCAVRELEEETGFHAGKIRKILEFFPSPGFSSENIHLFEAGDLEKSRNNLQDDDELIEVVALTVPEIIQLIHKGKIRDAKTIIGILLLFNSNFC